MENINNLTDQEIRELAERLAEVRGVVQQSSTSFSGGMADLTRASSSASETAYQVSQGLTGVGQGVIQFTKALADGKQDLKKYGAGVESAANGIGDLAGLFGPVGMVFGALIKVVGKVINEVLKQDQVYLDAYDALAEFGGVTGRTADELAKSVLGLTYNKETLPKLVKATTSLGTSIMSMGATAGEAQKAFFELSNVGMEITKEFGRLGISQENLTQIQADYIAQQSKVGIINVKSMDTLKKQSTDYATNLIKLSALTGQSTDQIKEARERDLADYRYAATERTELEAGRTEVVERMQSTLARVTGTFGPTYTEGIREIFATGLTNQTEASRTLNQITGGEIVNWVKQRKAGTMKEEEFLLKIQQANAAFEKKFGFSLMASENFQSSLAGFAEAQQGQSKQIGDAAATQAEIDRRKKEGADKLVDARASGNEITALLQKALDSFIQLIAGPVNYAFTALLDGFKSLAKGFIKQLSRLGFLPGDLEFMVMSYDELNQAQTKLTNQIEINSRLERENTSSYTPIDPEFGRGESASVLLRNELANDRKRLAALERVKAYASPPPAPAAPAAAPSAAAPSAAAPSAAAPAAAPAAPKPPETIRIGTKPGFAKGGITDGPMSGHLGVMHDLEAVVPLPDGKSIPVNLNIPQLAEKQKNPLLDTKNLASIIESYTQALTKSNGSSAQATFIQEAAATDFGFISTIAGRMETLIDSMKTNTSLQSELLYYVKR